MILKTHLSEIKKKYQLIEYWKLNEYQHNPVPVQQMEYETAKYTPHQNLLYKRALFGLSVYKKEEVKRMYGQKRKRIKKVHAKTQRILNAWKQELTIELTNPIFDFLIISAKDVGYNEPGLNFIRNMRECNDIDDRLENTLTFRDLGISKDQIINKLIEYKILPYNFREIEAPTTKQKV